MTFNFFAISLHQTLAWFFFHLNTKGEWGRARRRSPRFRGIERVQTFVQPLDLAHGFRLPDLQNENPVLEKWQGSESIGIVIIDM
jgi:hypothetical protein